MAGQVLTGQRQDVGRLEEFLNLAVAFQVGFQEEIVGIQAALGPDVLLLGLRQDLEQQFPVHRLLQVQRAGALPEAGDREQAQGPVDLPVDFPPFFELEDRLGFLTRLDAGNHGGENARPPFQQILTQKGINGRTFAGFHRAHHRQAAGLFGDVRLDLGEHLEPVLPLGRGLGKEAGPFPGHLLKLGDLLD